MPSENTVGTGNLTADILIVGGGGAGLAAAAAATEMGCTNVVILEKASAPGGNTLFAEGPFAVESPVQKRNANDADRNDFFRKALRWSHWKTDPRIVRAFVDKSGDSIRWLEEKGLNLATEPLFARDAPLTWHVVEGGGPTIIRALRKCCLDRGVRLLVRTKGRKILTGSTGNVTGVLAENDGHEFAITAKSVVIATGGFGASKELLKKYCPEYYDGMPNYGVPFNTGDGLLMALEAGADSLGVGCMMMAGPSPTCDRGAGKRGVFLKFDIPGSKQATEIPMSAIAMQRFTIWVNKKGRRFADEAGFMLGFDSGFLVNRQPGHLSYTLFDSSIRQYISERGIGARSDGGQKSLRLYSTPKAVPLPDLEKELRAQADRGNVLIADSLNEMAKKIGADPRVLQATIDEYNDACDQGNDPVFAKDPRFLRPLREAPYYAIQCSPIFLDTTGGIKANELMEVLDRQHDPIPGLYAAGVTVDGFEADVYDYELPGSASGFALTSGRIAGESASRFVLGH